MKTSTSSHEEIKLYLYAWTDVDTYKDVEFSTKQGGILVYQLPSVSLRGYIAD
jgi:hypothetical protein